MSDRAPFQSKQEMGQPLLDFSLPLLTGGSATLQSCMEEKKGAVVVFWSGVCAHCVRYDRYLNSFAGAHPDLSLIAIASRQGETPDQMRSAIVERNLTFRILQDPDAGVARQWFVQQTPRVFLLDLNRVLMYRGAIDNFKFPEDPDYQAYLEPAIEAFVAGTPITRKDTPSFGCAIQSVYYILPKAL